MLQPNFNPATSCLAGFSRLVLALLGSDQRFVDQCRCDAQGGLRRRERGSSRTVQGVIIPALMWWVTLCVLTTHPSNLLDVEAW